MNEQQLNEAAGFLRSCGCNLNLGMWLNHCLIDISFGNDTQKAKAIKEVAEFARMLMARGPL